MAAKSLHEYPDGKTPPKKTKDEGPLEVALGGLLLFGLPIALIAMLVDCSTTTDAERREAAQRDMATEQRLQEERARDQVRFQNARIGCDGGHLESCRALRDMVK